MRNFKSFTLILLFLLCCTICAAQQSKEAYGIERYLNIRSSTSPAISPDGKRVAFLTNITGTPQVWMLGAQGGWPEQMTFYEDRVDYVFWSPDGTGLVFGKSKGGDENAQLYWMSPDGSEIKALTNDPKVRHNFGGFSHDGKWISYSSNKRNPNYFDVYVMELATGREQLVYQQDGSNNPVAWSFSDKKLVVSRGNEELSLNNDLYLVDLTTKQATHLTPHEGAAQFGNVRFTPDDHSILFGTNDKREFYSLAQMDLQSKRVDIIDDTEWDLDSFEISPDGGLIAYTINRDGYSELYLRRLDTNGKPLITVVGAKEAPLKLPAKGIVTSLRFSRDMTGEAARDGNKLAFVFNSSRNPSDVWLYDLKTRQLNQITHSSLAGIPQSSFVEPELIRYKTFDGREIPAWYYRPQPQSSSKSLPVIVSAHGGPEGQAQPSFSAIFQYFLSRGYAVLAPNVRGSTGYGKTFTHLDDVRKREDSVKDLAAGVEWLKTAGGADAKRIAVMGGSYGGYMTLAAITLYPELWAAAVDTVGIANYESFLKNTSGYRRKLREVEYGSLERDLEFLKSISPLYKVDRIKAPLMVIQGKNDPRVPYTEAEQIVAALKKRGAIVEYKLFDDEGHGVAKLTNRLIVYPLMADFLDKYMK
ncbi:MAG: S9 family peptidase [Acidobacteria bacterium]|nr:S9 family peptidase [Acidobacteriota bacterium]